MKTADDDHTALARSEQSGNRSVHAAAGEPSSFQRVLAAFNPHIGDGPKRSWAGLLAQFVLITTAALLYFGVRTVTKEAEASAFSNARRLLEFEGAIGLDIEGWAQDQIIGNAAVVTFFNWVYIWLHWPVIVGTLLWLYRYNRRGFVLFRNGLMVSGAIGLVFFVTFPVAPPRFLQGYSDTVSDLSTSYQYLQPPGIVNKFAAMPSLHVGWNLLAGLILFNAIRRAPLRYLPLVSPVLMTLAVVVTANHYVVDAVVGAVVAIIGLYGGVRLTDWTEHRAAIEARITPEDDGVQSWSGPRDPI